MRQKPLICPLHLRQFIRLRKILMENLGLLKLEVQRASSSRPSTVVAALAEQRQPVALLTAGHFCRAARPTCADGATSGLGPWPPLVAAD